MLRYLRLYRLLNRTFGLYGRPLGTFGLLGLHRLLNATTRGLDHLLYPRVRSTPIQRPIFVLGNPRSGTTFVHRFLLHSGELCASELWEMLLPAVSARKLFDGLVSRLAPLSPARYHSSEAHETSLRDVETDDATAYFHFVFTGFLWSYYLAWEDDWGSEQARRMLEISLDPGFERRYYRYMEACWRRNLVYRGKQRILVKSPTLTLQAERLIQRYPDCKLIYLVRDPLATLPSGASLVTGVLERSNKMWSRTSAEARTRYFENLYQGACQLYRSVYEAQARGALPPERFTVVTYPQIMTELEATMERLVAFAGLKPRPGFWQRVREQAEKQRAYQSKHSYSLEKYGLSEERIRADLDYVYQAYDL